MKTDKILFKCLATFFSVLLVVSIVAVAVLGTAKSVVSPKGMTDILTKSIGNFDDVASHKNLDSDSLEAIMSTDAAEKILELYVEDFSRFAEDRSGRFEKDELYEIIIDEREEIIEAITDADRSVNEWEIRDNYDTFAWDAAVNIYDNVPVPTTIADAVDFDLQFAFSVVFGDTAVILLWVLIVLFAAAIFVFRFPKRSGAQWIGVSAITAGAPTAIFALIIKNIISLVPTESEAVAEVVYTVLDSVCNSLMTYGTIFLVIGILLVLGGKFLPKLIGFAFTNAKSKKPAAEAVGAAPQMKFDPHTGKPLTESKPKFDPMTGKPIADDQPKFDPITGEPLAANQPKFDPITGEKLR